MRSEGAPQCSLGARDVSLAGKEEAAAAGADGDHPGAVECGAALFEPGNDRLRLLGAPKGNERLGRVAVEDPPPAAGSGIPLAAAMTAAGPTLAAAAA